MPHPCRNRTGTISIEIGNVQRPSQRSHRGDTASQRNLGFSFGCVTAPHSSAANTLSARGLYSSHERLQGARAGSRNWVPKAGLDAQMHNLTRRLQGIAVGGLRQLLTRHVGSALGACARLSVALRTDRPLHWLPMQRFDGRSCCSMQHAAACCTSAAAQQLPHPEVVIAGGASALPTLTNGPHATHAARPAPTSKDTTIDIMAPSRHCTRAVVLYYTIQ